ncbi:MAG: FtsQ-type POTRA domain-containing protein [Kiritimatiellae bacterium]|nr:FtsQ-type POTRA domain-containing protein [Kiritimatiellia bacterium]MDD5522642.1 FtsQ-type POTRA domain-containing protein [Kiritimatiellia bacterium]
MWFDDEEANDRRLFRVRKRVGGRNTILRVNTRFADKKNSQKVGISVLLAVVIIGVTVLAWLGCRLAFRALFSDNDRFIIRNAIIQEGSVISSDLIKEYTQIKEGMNLFAFDITKVRKDFLRQCPNVKSMKIIRQLPDTLQISIVERNPVARIGRKSPFVADSEGYVFGLRLGYHELPVITGYRDPGLRPGSRLCGMALAALEVLEACYDQKIGLHIDEVEVNNPEYLVLYVPEGDKVKQIDLSWQGMGKRNAESRKKLMEKLSWVIKALQSEEGRRSLRLNATLDGRVFADNGVTTS